MDRTVRGLVRHSTAFAHLRSQDFSASNIRKSFLDFFCDTNKHLYIRSSPAFSLRDPTLAFVNAGMNQFKDVFLGLAKPASTRVANSQKCIRIGGKHNDLLQVGLDGTHHTFFEMLGNWSFGDYFKEEACRMSWNLLTQVYELPPERLYVTYFGGDKCLGLEADVEVQDIWRRIGVKESHILPFGVKDNFWEVGLIGPCGPCTEIHFDHLPGRTDAAHLVNAGTGDVTELWNLVFIQFNRKSDGSLENLRKHFVDTGMGFERLVAVLQGKTSNYDTDLFVPLFETISRYTGHSGYTGRYDGSDVDLGYRVLADHCRMIAVGLSDGMIPNHQSKLRRIIRKALTVAEKTFGADVGLLKELSNRVADIFSDAYPEIGNRLSKIHYILETEEELVKELRKRAATRWQYILKTHPSLGTLSVSENPQIVEGFEYIRQNVLEKGEKVLEGSDAWKLSDTFGVPVHVTEQMANGLGLKFELASYEDHDLQMKKVNVEVQQDKYSDRVNEVLSPEVVAKLEERQREPTLDSFRHEYRVDASGRYLFRKQEATIQAILLGNDVLDEISGQDVQGDQEIGLILDVTQMSAEDGGQESDRGTFRIENEILFDVRRVVKVKDFVVHFGTFRELPRDATVSAHNIGVLELDEDRRVKLMRNHTALHLLNAALRKLLPVTGEKYSRVSPDSLTLDVMLYKNVFSVGEVEKLEIFVRNVIRHGVPVRRRSLSHPQFQRLEEVVFVPGDTIIEAEIPVVEINSGFDLSREICGGTHVLNTSHVEDFVIKRTVNTFGVRRFEAVTGEEAANVKKEEAKAEGRWNHFRKEVQRVNAQPSLAKMKDLASNIRIFEKDVDNWSLSYVFKSKLRSKTEEAKKTLKKLMNRELRNIVKAEMEAIMENSKFVVYTMDVTSNSEASLLNTALDACRDRPIMVVTRNANVTSVQCTVPEGFVSEKFSAEKWLMRALDGSCGSGSSKKGQNPDLSYCMAKVEMTTDEVSKLIAAAKSFAEEHLPS